ncbi:hypothetical protein [Aneurinibacillus tyrosinisolvens]|uniref:hypothetical protein n=1 Tax=Aneurinibacillus tyrosinisolvens TaxID=1443435 RepID=UPI00063F18DD|nr:hypothetical protein [Aneurinibacillus tyrosinisolvens]
MNLSGLPAYYIIYFLLTALFFILVRQKLQNSRHFSRMFGGAILLGAAAPFLTKLVGSLPTVFCLFFVALLLVFLLFSSSSEEELIDERGAKLSAQGEREVHSTSAAMDNHPVPSEEIVQDDKGMAALEVATSSETGEDSNQEAIQEMPAEKQEHPKEKNEEDRLIFDSTVEELFTEPELSAAQSASYEDTNSNVEEEFLSLDDFFIEEEKEVPSDKDIEEVFEEEIWYSGELLLDEVPLVQEDSKQKAELPIEIEQGETSPKNKKDNDDYISYLGDVFEEEGVK